MFIAGIGSRDLDVRQRKICYDIGKYLASKGHTLVTGGAVGADQAFAAGAASVDPSLVQLYVPWPGYEMVRYPDSCHVYSGPYEDRDWQLAQLHPAWANLSPAVRKLMVRNAKIVRTSKQVVAWPRLAYGRWTGGTAHGLHIAQHLGISVIDLSDPRALRRVLLKIS